MKLLKKGLFFGIALIVVAAVAGSCVIRGVIDIALGVADGAKEIAQNVIRPALEGIDLGSLIAIGDGGVIVNGQPVSFPNIPADDGEAVVQVGGGMSGQLTDVTEAGFVQNRYTFPANLNRDLSIDVSGCDIVIAAAETGGSIYVDVLENDDFTYTFKTVDNTLTISDDQKESDHHTLSLFGVNIDFGAKERKAAYTGLAMIVYLPESFDGDIEIADADGDVRLGNLSLEGRLTAETTNGLVDVKNLDAYEISLVTSNERMVLSDLSATYISVSTANDRITMDSLSARTIEVTDANASIDFTRLFGEKFTFTTSNGDIMGSILGEESLFRISTMTNLSASPKSAENSRAQYVLNASTVEGDINIRFVS